MMPSEQSIEQSIFQSRLHPLTLLFALSKSIRGLVISAIPMLALSKRGWILSILGLMFLVSFARALARYFSFSYRIEAGELIISQGLLERTERHILLERIQEIKIKQGVVHRIFGVVDANVETAGGEGPEASLSVLSTAEVERLRRAIFENAAVSEARERSITAAPLPQAERTILRRLGVRDLVLAGATSNHLVTASIFVGTLMAYADNLFSQSIYEKIVLSINDAVGEMVRQDIWATIIVTLIGILLILFLTVVFSIAGSVLVFYRFTLSQSSEDLHRSYGLMTYRASSLPRHRIQMLKIDEGFLRRLFRLASLRVDTVGSRAERGEERDSGQGVLIPVIRRDEVETLLPAIFPDLDSEPSEWKRVSRLAIKRGMVKGGAVCLFIATALLFYHKDLTGLWPLLFLPIIYVINILRYRNFGYALGERFFQIRSGWPGRSTYMVPIRKAQVIEVRQTILDRRLGLASLMVDTAGQSAVGDRSKISNLPVAEAYRIAHILAQKATIHTRF
jgi:putative membrane protein